MLPSRWIVPLLVGLVTLGGCVAAQRILPVGGGPVAKAVQARLTLVADADAWQGYPDDLPETMTPIWVDIVNGGNEDIAVTYSDFALTDERGFRYAAINPYTGAAVRERGSEPAPAPRPAPATQQTTERTLGRGVLVAALGHSATDAAPMEPGARLLARRFRPRVYRRFYVHPRARLYFHYHAPWPGVIYYPPGYTVHVHRWGPGYPGLSDDIRQLGLPEGVVQPGGRVSGFLYFQNASLRAHWLTLDWTARTPRGAQIARLGVRFVVQRE